MLWWAHGSSWTHLICWEVLPRIDDVSPCLWAAFLLMWGYLVAYLIPVCSCAFCLDLWSVFSCSWSVFSLLIHLHTNIYQHSWKWSVINPYHYVDVYILCIYAGVDGLILVLKNRQQKPLARILFAIVFLQILHIVGVKPTGTQRILCSGWRLESDRSRLQGVHDTWHL